MKKAASILKKAFKVIVWIILSFLFLLLVVATLIQIPAIQLKVANKATTYISDKTNTKVELKKIRIQFPKSVVIDGLYLEDLEKDTLLYAGHAKVNLSFNALFHHKIHLYSFVLEDARLFVNRTRKDTLFNYQFLLDAFSTGAAKPATTAPSWKISVNHLRLSIIRLKFDDEVGGTFLAVFLNDFNLKSASVDLDKQEVELDEIGLSKRRIGHCRSRNSKG